jgi:quercetin dioxygenase-like cupin family protein
VAQAGDEFRNPVTGQRIRFLEISDEVLVVEASYEPGARRAPAHHHPAQHERITVLSGTVQCTVAGVERTLCKGESIEIQPGVPHDIAGDAERRGRVRWETRPALRTADFLETMLGLAQDRRVSPKTGVPGLLQVALTAREYGPEFRLVKPPRPIQVALFALLAPLGRARGLRPTYRPESSAQA